MKTWFSLALIVCSATLSACGSKSADAPRDSQTHWLSTCEEDAECGALACVCGVCTRECNNDEACETLDDDAVCANPERAGNQCSGEAPRACLEGSSISAEPEPSEPEPSEPDPEPVPNEPGPDPLGPTATLGVDAATVCQDWQELVGQRVSVRTSGEVETWLSGTDAGCECCNEVEGGYAIICSESERIPLQPAEGAPLGGAFLHESIATNEGDVLQLGCAGLQCAPVCTHGDGSVITEVVGELFLDTSRGQPGEITLSVESVETSEPPAQPYALTLDEDKTLVPGEYQYCALDDHCTLVEDTCSGCCSETSIAATLQSTFVQEFALACEDYSGGECDCEPEPREATCSVSACEACVPIEFERGEVVSSQECPLQNRPEDCMGWSDAIVIGEQGCWDFPADSACPEVDPSNETLVVIPLGSSCDLLDIAVVECEQEVVIKVAEPANCPGCTEEGDGLQLVRMPRTSKSISVHTTWLDGAACPAAD